MADIKLSTTSPYTINQTHLIVVIKEDDVIEMAHDEAGWLMVYNNQLGYSWLLRTQDIFRDTTEWW